MHLLVLLVVVSLVTLSRILGGSSILSTRAKGDSGKVAKDVDVLARGGNGSGAGVDTDGDVADETIFEAGSQLCDIDDGGVSVGAGRGVEGVLGVGGTVQGELVGGVGGKLVDGVDEVLLEEQLTDVLDVSGAVGGVGAGDVGLDGDVDVSGAGAVVAGEDGQELGHAVVVGLGNSAEESRVVGGAVVTLGPAVHDLDGVGVDTNVTGVGAGSIASLIANVRKGFV